MKTLLKAGVKQMPVQMCQPLCERKLGMLLLINVLLWHYTEEGPEPRNNSKIPHTPFFTITII